MCACKIHKRIHHRVRRCDRMGLAIAMMKLKEDTTLIAGVCRRIFPTLLTGSLLRTGPDLGNQTNNFSCGALLGLPRNPSRAFLGLTASWNPRRGSGTRSGPKL